MIKRDYICPTILVRNVHLSMAVLSTPAEDKINPQYGAKTDIFTRDPGFYPDLKDIDVENDGPWDGID